MRRLAIAASLLVCCASGCVSPEPARPAPTYRPTYKPYARRERPMPPETPVPPAAYVPPKPGPTWFPRSGRISSRWTHIIIHHSATNTGGAAAFDKYHREQKGWDELGYHFVIGNGTNTPDGNVEVGSRWHKQKHGAHCKTPDNYYNDHGIGICLVGNFNATRPTARQYASLQQLVRFLARECRIPPDRVTTHKAVARKTQCPGRNFELASLRRAL